LYGINADKGTWSNFWDERDPVADPLNTYERAASHDRGFVAVRVTR
jgi:hypothetical protein